MASQRAIRAARAFVEISGDDSKLRKVLSGVKSTMGTLAKGAAVAAGAGVAAIGAAAAGAAASVFKFAAAGDALDKMSGRTGATAEALSQLGFAAEQSGTSIDTVERSILAMNRVLLTAERGGKAATDTLAELGLSIDDLRGLKPDQQMEVLADALSKVSDPGRRAALAMQTMGRSGAEMLPLLNGGAEGIQALRTEADQLGLTITGPQAKAAAAFTDAWNRIKRAVGAAFIQIGAKLAPMMTDLAGRVLPYVVTGAKLVAAGVQAAAAAAVRAGQVIAQGINYVAESFPHLTETTAEHLGGLKDALLSGEFGLAARIMWLGLKMRWAEGVDALNHEWQIWKKAFTDTFNAAINAVLRKWHELQNLLSTGVVKVMAFLDSSIDADAVTAELDQMLQQQLRAVDANAERDQAARDAAFENDIGRVNKELEEARAEWQAAVSRANRIAEERANEPNVAGVADGKFTKLIEDLQAGEIATRVEQAVKAPTAAGDLRTTAGAGLLVGLLNRQGTVEGRQLKVLERLAQLNSHMLKLQKSGPKAIKI